MGVQIYRPTFLDLGTDWRWAVSFSPRERAPSTHWIGGWVGTTASLDIEKWKFLSPAGHQLRHLGHPAHSQLLSRFSTQNNTWEKPSATKAPCPNCNMSVTQAVNSILLLQNSVTFILAECTSLAVWPKLKPCFDVIYQHFNSTKQNMHIYISQSELNDTIFWHDLAFWFNWHRKTPCIESNSCTHKLSM
jgi:hypothetical protein